MIIQMELNVRANEGKKRRKIEELEKIKINIWNNLGRIPRMDEKEKVKKVKKYGERPKKEGWSKRKLSTKILT